MATTPSVVINDNPTSRRSYFQISRSVLTSNSENAAKTSTAPSAATGTYRSGSVKNNSTAAMVIAATSPVTCVRPPAATPTAVRESAPVTTKPCDSAEAMLATPKAANSRSTSIRYPPVGAKVRAVNDPLVNTTSARPAAAPVRDGTSCSGTVGQRSCGSPAGTGPSTATPCASSSRTAVVAPATISAASAAGK